MLTEKEIQQELFPDHFIAWLILELDNCDDHILDFDNLINVKYWLDRKMLLQEVREKYQKLVLDKRESKTFSCPIRGIIKMVTKGDLE